MGNQAVGQTLRKYSPEIAEQRGFILRKDNDGDGQISEGDIVAVPVKRANEKEVRMIGIPYNQQYGHLLEEILYVDPTQNPDNFDSYHTAISGEAGTAYAEYTKKPKGDGIRFGYFTTLLFGEEARVRLKALGLLKNKTQPAVSAKPAEEIKVIIANRTNS